ncbi:hypothetical protein [Streptomyces griseorubiginosus]|uniref:hypothetical protein n=1 Tax=Streptomyces griseorubiginosus TaxID=67304 RepID=UPI0036EFF80A
MSRPRGLPMFTEYNRAFLAAQRAAPDHAMAARGADQLLDDLGIAFRSLPYYFRIDPATHATLARATRTLVDAQEKLVRHVCSTRTPDELRELFDVPPKMAARMDWPTVATRGLRMLRADIVPTDSGYWFCEVNHFSGVGATEGYYSAYAFAELLGRSVVGVSPIRQQAHLYMTECRRGGFTRFVILDSTKHQAYGFSPHWLLQRYLRLMAPDIEIHYHDELTYPSEWLAPAEARKTLIHRLVTVEDTSDEGEFLVALRDSGATFSDLFEGELKMHRRWFSMLCDPEYQKILSEEERQVVQEYVPHTFDLSSATLDSALADKDRLVFKRSYTYGGKEVLIGDRYSAEELRALLSVDVSGWNCQRRLHTSILELPGPDGELVPYHYVLGMYLYGDGASGLLVRGTAHSPVVNLSQGGGVSWAFVE